MDRKNGIKIASLTLCASLAVGLCHVNVSASPLAGAVASMYQVDTSIVEKQSSLAGANFAMVSMIERAKSGEAAAEHEAQSEKVTEEAKTPGEFDNVAIATVNDYVNIRNMPSEEGEAIGKLYPNGAATLLAVDGDWSYISSGSVVGYVKSEFLTVGDSDLCILNSKILAIINADALNVRADASTEAPVVMRKTQGESVAVIDLLHDNPDWVMVAEGDEAGFVNTEFCTVSRIYNSVAESKAEEEARLAYERKLAEAAARAIEAARAQQAANKSAKKSSSSKSSGGSGKSYSAPSGSGGSSVANYGLQFVGNPYVYGGTSLTNGTDCSGFVLSVYKAFGVSLPHSSSALRSVGTGVSQGEMAPGDIVCYSGHVGIAIGGGQIVHASNRRDGIKVSNANYKKILAVRRVF